MKQGIQFQSLFLIFVILVVLTTFTHTVTGFLFLYFFFFTVHGYIFIPIQLILFGLLHPCCFFAQVCIYLKIFKILVESFLLEKISCSRASTQHQQKSEIFMTSCLYLCDCKVRAVMVRCGGVSGREKVSPSRSSPPEMRSPGSEKLRSTTPCC